MSFRALVLIMMTAAGAGCSSVGPAGPQPPPPTSVENPVQGPGHLDHPEELNNLDNTNLGLP